MNLGFLILFYHYKYILILEFSLIKNHYIYYYQSFLLITYPILIGWKITIATNKIWLGMNTWVEI